MFRLDTAFSVHLASRTSRAVNMMIQVVRLPMFGVNLCGDDSTGERRCLPGVWRIRSV